MTLGEAAPSSDRSVLDGIIQEVAQAEIAKKAAPSDVWESENRPGVRFKLLKMPRMALVEANTRIPVPKVPKVYMPDKDREEENPSHPDYLEAVRQYNIKVAIVGIDTCLVLGTELMPPLPDNVQKPEDEDWVERLSVIQLEVPTGKYARYVTWVRWYLLTEQEVMALAGAVTRFNGSTLEVDVQTATEEFKSAEERESNTGSPTQEAG